MTISVNWQSKVVYSDGSITDLPAHHLALRDLESSTAGMLYDPICAWQLLNLGGGATLPQVDYINGYVLEFIGAGPFVISGNLNATINDTGVQVERKTSAAYATTAVGGSGPTAESIAAAVGQRIIDNGLSNDALLRILLAALAGKTTGLGTATEQYLGQDGITPRITAQFDTNNNRTSVTLNGGV